MFMMQSFFKSIALSLVFISIGAVEFSANAKISSAEELNRKLVNTISTNPIYIAQSTTSSPSIEPAVEQAVHNRINQYRAAQGLSPLSVDERITREARIHSQNMASGKVPFGHNGFSQRVQAIAIPYRASAENVAYNRGYSDPDARAVDGWLKSSGHLKNIKGNYNLTGIGVAKNAQGAYYFTQIFILKR